MGTDVSETYCGDYLSNTQMSNHYVRHLKLI